LSKVKEVFIDATYNTSKQDMHLYTIIAEELGYGIPIAYMLVHVPKQENTKTKQYEHEALQCNEHFFQAARDLGVNPTYVHLDKDFAEISAAQVLSRLLEFLTLEMIWTAIISLCCWHAKRAVAQYFCKNQQWHFSSKHPPLNYSDPDHERSWDADFLDSNWVRLFNEENERNFRAGVISRNRHIIDPEEMEAEILKMGKKLQICVKETENRNKLVDLFMCHLRWHPLTHSQLPITIDEVRKIDQKDVWQQQTLEMHEVCKLLGESWAWEYLWKSW
jgi:hypothetical protein